MSNSRTFLTARVTYSRGTGRFWFAADISSFLLFHSLDKENLKSLLLARLTSRTTPTSTTISEGTYQAQRERPVGKMDEDNSTVESQQFLPPSFGPMRSFGSTAQPSSSCSSTCAVSSSSRLSLARETHVREEGTEDDLRMRRGNLLGIAGRVDGGQSATIAADLSRLGAVKMKGSVPGVVTPSSQSSLLSFQSKVELGAVSSYLDEIPEALAVVAEVATATDDLQNERDELRRQLSMERRQKEDIVVASDVVGLPSPKDASREDPYKFKKYLLYGVVCILVVAGIVVGVVVGKKEEATLMAQPSGEIFFPSAGRPIGKLSLLHRNYCKFPLS